MRGGGNEEGVGEFYVFNFWKGERSKQIKDDKVFFLRYSFVMTGGCIILYFVQYRCLVMLYTRCCTCLYLIISFYCINVLIFCQSHVIVSIRVLLYIISLPN